MIFLEIYLLIGVALLMMLGLVAVIAGDSPPGGWKELVFGAIFLIVGWPFLLIGALFETE